MSTKSFSVVICLLSLEGCVPASQKHVNSTRAFTITEPCEQMLPRAALSAVYAYGFIIRTASTSYWPLLPSIPTKEGVVYCPGIQNFPPLMSIALNECPESFHPGLLTSSVSLIVLYLNEGCPWTLSKR